MCNVLDCMHPKKSPLPHSLTMVIIVKFLNSWLILLPGGAAGDHPNLYPHAITDLSCILPLEVR